MQWALRVDCPLHSGLLDYDGLGHRLALPSNCTTINQRASAWASNGGGADCLKDTASAIAPAHVQGKISANASHPSATHR